jgi:hypothetical protein
MIGLDPWDDATSRRDSRDDGGAPGRRSEDSAAPGSSSDESWDDDEYEDWLFL